MDVSAKDRVGRSLVFMALVAAVALLLGLAGAPPAHADDERFDVSVKINVSLPDGTEGLLEESEWMIWACLRVGDNGCGSFWTYPLEGSVTGGLSGHILNLPAGEYKFRLNSYDHGVEIYHGGASWEDAKPVSVGSGDGEAASFDVSLRSVNVDFAATGAPEGWSASLYLSLHKDGGATYLGRPALGSAGSAGRSWPVLVSPDVDRLILRGERGSGVVSRAVDLDLDQDAVRFDMKLVTLKAQVDRTAGSESDAEVYAYRINPETGKLDSGVEGSLLVGESDDSLEQLVAAGTYAFMLMDYSTGKMRWLGGSAASPETFEVDGAQPNDLVFEFGVTEATVEAPEVSGAAQVGQTLTAQAGEASPRYGVMSYQWYRNDDPIKGATKPTYKLTAEDQGKRIRVEATYTSYELAPASEKSAATDAVAIGKLTTVPLVSVAGSAQVGKTLTAKHSEAKPAATAKYQWYRGSSAIKGATNKTYKLAAADKGQQIKVKVTYSAKGYETKSVTSAATSKVTAGKLTTTPKPTITGTKQVGKTLTAKHSASSPAGTAKYQWYRGSSAIKGATKKTYKLVAKDKGQKIKVKVTYSKSGYTAKSATSVATGKVAAGKLTAAPKPTISGTKKVGKTLTAKKVAYKPAGGKVTYQWYRGSSKIKGATKAKYKLVKADKGKKIKVKTTYKLAGYTTASKTSAATSKIK